MKIPIYQIDAFADGPFQGNPAAICPLQEWLPDTVLQAIAEENNLAETAFYVQRDGEIQLRWFTPTTEVDLCGHATLAAAHVVFQRENPPSSVVTFQSRSGELPVTREENGMLTLNFPSQPGTSAEAPRALIEGLGAEPVAYLRSEDHMAVFEDEATVRSLEPDFRTLQQLDLRGVIATAPGDDVDFVSRFFAPNFGIDEDPVTGSAHCMLTPYWAERLNLEVMQARQLSKRTGSLRCRLETDRVHLSGNTVSYLEGEIEVMVDI